QKNTAPRSGPRRERQNTHPPESRAIANILSGRRSERVCLYQFRSHDSPESSRPRNECTSVELHGAPSMSMAYVPGGEGRPPLLLRRNRRYWSGRIAPNALSRLAMRSLVNGGPASLIAIIIESLSVKIRRCAQSSHEAPPAPTAWLCHPGDDAMCIH